MDMARVEVLVAMGYPQDYVEATVGSKHANYCLAGYLLLGIDQNY